MLLIALAQRCRQVKLRLMPVYLWSSNRTAIDSSYLSFASLSLEGRASLVVMVFLTM